MRSIAKACTLVLKTLVPPTCSKKWYLEQPAFNVQHSVNLPGGAKGASESQPINLSGYSADDLPMLYFNYYLSTENRNAGNFNDTNFMRDSFACTPRRTVAIGRCWPRTTPTTVVVLHRRTSSTWKMNTIKVSAPTSMLIGNPLVVQELYDVNDPGVPGQDPGGQAPDSWRQARLNLSPFAGSPNLRLRFEFSTGGNFNTGNP